MSRKIRKLLAICLSVLLIMTATVPAFALSEDLEGHWASNVISKWIDNSWIKGYPDGTFGPDNLLKKSEFIALANRSLGLTDKAEISAIDVSQKDWFFDDIGKAVAAGYLTVASDGTVDPEKPVSREDVAVMLSKMFALDTASENDVLGKFSDAGDVSPENKGAVNAVVEKGHGWIWYIFWSG